MSIRHTSYFFIPSETYFLSLFPWFIQSWHLSRGNSAWRRDFFFLQNAFAIAEILTKCLKGSFIFGWLKQSIEEMLKIFHNWMTFICQLVSAGSEVIDKLCTMSPHLLFNTVTISNISNIISFLPKTGHKNCPVTGQNNPELFLFCHKLFWSNHCVL